MTSDVASTSHDNNRSMMLTSKNLAYLMSKKGVDAATLCGVTGLGIATVNSLRRGIGNPTLSTLMGLANYFNVNLSELTEIDLSEKEFKRSSAKAIPLIKINDINKFIDKQFDKYETYTTEMDESNERSCFAVLVNNDSLYPQFSPGTVFIISKDEEPCDGDIVLVKISTHNPCFRKIFIDGDNFLFSSISIEHDISPSIYREYKLIGVVLKAIKTFSGR